MHKILTHTDQRPKSGGFRMSKKNPPPTWYLTEGYGCSTDPYNWKLLQKFGERWKPIGYYATPEKMLDGLYRKMCRGESADRNLIKHVSAISGCVQAAAARLSIDLNQLAWSQLQRPPAHRKPTTQRRKNAMT